MSILNNKIKSPKSKTSSHTNRIPSYQMIPLLCPRCKMVMKKINEFGVTIDYCQNCSGMWLDKGEVDKLIELDLSKNIS